MMRRQAMVVWFVSFIMAVAVSPAICDPEEKKVSFGLIGIGGVALETMRAAEEELNIRIVQITSDQFRRDQLPDISALDAIFVSFADETLKDEYRQAIVPATAENPALKIFCVGPPAAHQMWSDWVGAGRVKRDPAMAAYYGQSRQDMQNMLRYALATYCGRRIEVPPPGVEKAIKIYHPKYGQLDSIEDFLSAARKDGWDTSTAWRAAVGSFRNHCIFHQPKVVDALIEEFGRQGILAVCIIAHDPDFADRLLEYKPDLVVMTSHTFEPSKFWEQLNVPRMHAVWFLDESIDEWRTSVTTGMIKSAIQHMYIMAEIRGSTECLVSGGTRSGHRSGEEVLPIPDRISRLVGRSKSWIRLRHTANKDKKVAVIGWDHEADKSRLLCGALQGLNAPRSLVVLLREMKKAGYAVENLPADERELLDRLIDHGRQMGSWEPAVLDRLARSGKAALIPEVEYRKWFEEKVPPREQKKMIKYWGEPPGSLMVWEKDGEEYLVLPKVDMGSVVLITQPPKGETLSATSGKPMDDDVLPPTHHFLATYFWLQEEFKPHALIHFGAHGNEWLFPGKQAALSKTDWTDMMFGNMPNINPWMSNNTSELCPCKRRAFALTIDHLPPILMNAGLSDELVNLQSTIDKYITLDEGVLKAKFAASVTEQVVACRLEGELKLERSADGILTDEDVDKVSAYLHDLQTEVVPANMQVLGQKPSEELLLPYFVYCMGQEYLEAVRPLFNLPDEEIRTRSEDVVRLMLNEGLSPVEAVKAAGGKVESDKLPEKALECLEMVVEMNKGLEQTGQEITNILRALNGEFIPPGPSGGPERNPGVVPTGRNMYVLNPEELPTRSSWELGTKMMAEYLETLHQRKGGYPRKIAFALIPYATYSDYGIIESQALYLLGVRPVWDSRNRVSDLEPIPRKELGRPRIDVFLSAKSVYREELPEMMRLLDKAVRMVAELDEPDNYVYEHSVRMRQALQEKGIEAQKAEILSKARMYGTKPEETVSGHGWYFYLAERSGEWENRQDLLDEYLRHCKNVYTDQMWGVYAPESFDHALQGTELILRSWYDHRDTVLSNKFMWWSEGSLSLAIKHLTGKEPAYMFADVRNPDKAAMIDAEQAMQRDLRARVLNPKWIEAVMNEGYNGATQISRNIDNLMGWKIMRDASVTDANWQDIHNIYVRDSENLHLREWFEAQNPHAFQKMTGTMLETIRKGYWAADAETVQEIVAAYADSVARHGPVSGIRQGGNEKLQQFVEETLSSLSSEEMKALLKQYQQKIAETQAPKAAAQEQVKGKRLAKTEADEKDAPLDDAPIPLLIGIAALLIVYVGFRRGPSISRNRNRRR